MKIRIMVLALLIGAYAACGSGVPTQSSVLLPGPSTGEDPGPGLDPNLGVGGARTVTGTATSTSSSASSTSSSSTSSSSTSTSSGAATCNGFSATCQTCLTGMCTSAVDTCFGSGWSTGMPSGQCAVLYACLCSCMPTDKMCHDSCLASPGSTCTACASSLKSECAACSTQCAF